MEVGFEGGQSPTVDNSSKLHVPEESHASEDK
jgi:hypothetical protein